MENEKSSPRGKEDRGGFSGEDQSGPVGNNAPHGRSSHSDPGMNPGISQAAKEARKKDESEGQREEGEASIEEEASLEQQRKEASTERD